MSEFKSLTLTLKSSDLKATIDFYVKTLGFTLHAMWPHENPTSCLLDNGKVHLMFSSEAAWDAPGAAPTLTGQIYFEVADATAIYRKVLNKVEVLWGPEVYSYGRREFSIKDCNGYRLVFSEETTDPPTCEE